MSHDRVVIQERTRLVLREIVRVTFTGEGGPGGGYDDSVEDDTLLVYDPDTVESSLTDDLIDQGVDPVTAAAVAANIATVIVPLLPGQPADVKSALLNASVIATRNVAALAAFQMYQSGQNTALQAAISAEEMIRSADDTAINGRIDVEDAARTAADDALNERIDDEEAARAAGDNALDARVDVLESSGSGLALGETSTTAYRGDRGKTAYDHSQITDGNPHGVDKADVGLSNVDDVSAVNLRDRSTHTGVQAISTITDLQTTLDAKLVTNDAFPADGATSTNRGWIGGVTHVAAHTFGGTTAGSGQNIQLIPIFVRRSTTFDQMLIRLVAAATDAGTVIEFGYMLADQYSGIPNAASVVSVGTSDIVTAGPRTVTSPAFTYTASKGLFYLCCKLIFSTTAGTNPTWFGDTGPGWVNQRLVDSNNFAYRYQVGGVVNSTQTLAQACSTGTVQAATGAAGNVTLPRLLARVSAYP